MTPACVHAGPQYGTLEKAWVAIASEAEGVSELHLQVKAALMNEDFEKIKNWQTEAFHKQMMGGFKETKEAEDGFRKAQKPWAKKLKEVRPPASGFPAFRRPMVPAGDPVALVLPRSNAPHNTPRSSCLCSFRNRGRATPRARRP